MILICVIPFTESLITGPGHVICIKGYVILICLTLFTESLTKGPGHVMCISMYMYMYLNYDLISTTLLRKRKRIDDFSQSYWFCRVSIFVWLWFPVLYLMPYILGTFSVLTPPLFGGCVSCRAGTPRWLAAIIEDAPVGLAAPFAPGVSPSQSLYDMSSGWMLETLQTASWVLVVSLYAAPSADMSVCVM